MEKIDLKKYVDTYNKMKKLNKEQSNQYQMSFEVFLLSYRTEFMKLLKPKQPVRPERAIKPKLSDCMISLTWLQWIFEMMKVMLSIPVMVPKLFGRLYAKMITFIITASVFYLLIPAFLINLILSVPLIGMTSLQMTTPIWKVLFTIFIRTSIVLLVGFLLVVLIGGIIKYLYLHQSLEHRQKRYQRDLDIYEAEVKSYPNEYEAWKTKFEHMRQIIDDEKEEYESLVNAYRQVLSDIPLSYQNDEMMNYIDSLTTEFDSIQEFVEDLTKHQNAVEEAELEAERLRLERIALEKQQAREKRDAERKANELKREEERKIQELKREEERKIQDLKKEKERLEKEKNDAIEKKEKEALKKIQDQEALEQLQSETERLKQELEQMKLDATKDKNIEDVLEIKNSDLKESDSETSKIEIEQIENPDSKDQVETVDSESSVEVSEKKPVKPKKKRQTKKKTE